MLDEQEQEMLARNCAARRPGRGPYEMAEYIALLIRQDDARVRGRINSISKRCCCKCGSAAGGILPAPRGSRLLGDVRLARNQTVSILIEHARQSRTVRNGGFLFNSIR